MVHRFLASKQSLELGAHWVWLLFLKEWHRFLLVSNSFHNVVKKIFSCDFIRHCSFATKNKKRSEDILWYSHYLRLTIVSSIIIYRKTNTHKENVRDSILFLNDNIKEDHIARFQLDIHKAHTDDTEPIRTNMFTIGNLDIHTNTSSLSILNQLVELGPIWFMTKATHTTMAGLHEKKGKGGGWGKNWVYPWFLHLNEHCRNLN